MEEIKKASQDGECIHDYFGTEMTRRGGRWIKHFVTTHNDVYEIIFYTSEPAIIRRVLRWINIARDITNRNKVRKAIGDFFEFFEFYLIAQNRPNLFASMALRSPKNGRRSFLDTHYEILYMFNHEPGEVDGGIPDDYYDGGPLPSDICSSATQKQV